MKRIMVLLTVLMMIVQSLAAQEETERKGKKAFIFSFSGRDIENFGFKYWLTEQLSLTGIFIFNFESEQRTDTQNFPERKSARFGRGIGVHHSVLSYKDVSIYGLGEIHYFWGNSKIESSPSVLLSGATYRNQSLLIGAGIGIEYWVLEHLSLSGQHAFQALFQKSTERQDSFPENTTTRQQYELGESLFIVSFYF